MTFSDSLLAKLAGETIVSGIAPWARWRTAWLCPLLRVPHGRLPCANTSPHRCAKVAIADLNRRLAACFVPPLPPLPETAAPSAADPPAPASPCALPTNRFAKSWPWPVSPRRTPDGRSASGPVARLRTKSSNAASSPRSPGATPRACSKGGSPTAPEPLLADAAQRRPVGQQGRRRL